MASIRKIEGKKGVTYKLIAYCGYGAKQIRKFKTWRPDKGMTAKQAHKQATIEAELYEAALNRGAAAFDGKVKFEEYAAVWMEHAQIAPKTRERYVVLLRRINAGIGFLKLETPTAATFRSLLCQP